MIDLFRNRPAAETGFSLGIWLVVVIAIHACSQTSHGPVIQTPTHSQQTSPPNPRMDRMRYCESQSVFAQIEYAARKANQNEAAWFYSEYATSLTSLQKTLADLTGQTEKVAAAQLGPAISASQLMKTAWRQTTWNAAYPVDFNRQMTQLGLLAIRAATQSGDMASAGDYAQSMIDDTSLNMTDSERLQVDAALAESLIIQGHIKEAAKVLARGLTALSCNQSDSHASFDEVWSYHWLATLKLLRRIGQYQFVVDGAALGMRRTQSDAVKAKLTALVIECMKSVDDQDLALYQPSLNFVPDKLFGMAVKENVDTLLAALYLQLATLTPIGTGDHTLGRMLCEYHLRKAGLKEAADVYFKRTPTEVYHPLAEDSLPHFLYAYNKILELGNSIDEKGLQDAYYQKLFSEHQDKLPSQESFNDKLLSAANELLGEQTDETIRLEILATRLTNEHKISLTPDDPWLKSLFENLIQMSLERGDIEKAQAYSLFAGDHLAAQRRAQIFLFLNNADFKKGGRGDLNARRTIESFYQQGISLYEEMVKSIPSTNERSGFYREIMAGSYGRLIEFNFEVEDPKQAFLNAEKAKSRSLRDLLTHQRSTLQQSDIQLKIEGLSSGNRGLLLTRPARMEERTLESIAKSVWNASVDTAEEEPDETNNPQNEELSIEKIQESLEDKVMLEYYVSGDTIYSFLITKDDFQVRQSETVIDCAQTIADLRKKVISKQPMEKEATRLFEMLIGDWQKYTVGRHVVIVPHGFLHYLPFQLMKNKKSGKFLLEESTLAYAPSASIYLTLASRINKGMGTVVFADPGTDGLALPGARTEGKTVAEQLNGNLFLGSEATESSFQTSVVSASVVHVATHGFFDSEHPQFTGLLFAPEGTDDGVMILQEISSTRLNSDVVVLSACETGLSLDPRGRSKKSVEDVLAAIPMGDEVVGLSQAFISAGTRSVVSSSWKVDDDATRDLMIEFYAGLKQGASLAEAIRAAQLKLLATAKFAHPYYWASFSYVGPLNSTVNIAAETPQEPLPMPFHFYDATNDEMARKKMGVWGGVTLALGVMAVGSGVGLHIHMDKSCADTSCPADASSTWNGIQVLYGLGGLSFLSGTALLITNQILKRRDKRRRSFSDLHFSILDTHIAGARQRGLQFALFGSF